MIYFCSAVFEKSIITSRVEHVCTARCSLFESLTQMRKLHLGPGVCGWLRLSELSRVTGGKAVRVKRIKPMFDF